MSTIKVRKISLDRLGLKTSRLLYNELPSVRALVHSWFDGNPLDLLKPSSAGFLRRLVVRSLRELSPSNEELSSYGGTSSDDNKQNLAELFNEANGPFEEVREISGGYNLCTICQAGVKHLYVLRTVESRQFVGCCADCYSYQSTC